jgi:shikimate dehydrogenase
MRFGLIGEKLSHSYSKIIHEKLGQYEYDLLPTPPEELESVLRDTSYGGFNITIPYKRAVMDYCGELSDTARRVGCVNTVVRCPDGKLYGHNTDLGGFLAMARRAGISFEGKKCAILGSGGTSLTARAACEMQGASEIVVVSRSGEVGYGDTGRYKDAGILINTTPVGMFPGKNAAAVDLTAFDKLEGVADVIYNPLRTRLIQQARELNIPNAAGLYMLVSQAILAAELFCGRTFERETRRIFGELFTSRANIALIGMPGCGKTTVGECLAEMTGRPLYDTDGIIENREDLSITEIFARFGEEHFRRLESEVLAECALKSGAIIATGGGAILREVNRVAMRANSCVYLIERSGELPTYGRPLSKDAESLRKLELFRAAYYAASADRAVANTTGAYDTARRILDEFNRWGGIV